MRQDVTDYKLELKVYARKFGISDFANDLINIEREVHCLIKKRNFRGRLEIKGKKNREIFFFFNLLSDPLILIFSVIISRLLGIGK